MIIGEGSWIVGVGMRRVAYVSIGILVHSADHWLFVYTKVKKIESVLIQ